MVPRIEDVLAAWESLQAADTGEGWRSIPLGSLGPCGLYAARRFPDNVEALIFRTPGISMRSKDRMPAGEGFEVSRIDFKDGPQGALAVSRSHKGSSELFLAMVNDLLEFTKQSLSLETGDPLRALLARIQLWQEFMRPAQARLGKEAELGLFGELVVIDQLTREQFALCDVLRGWEGPCRGLHDLVVNGAALEIKTSRTDERFVAHIGSLAQLDETVRSPLFLAAVRLQASSSGETLSELISRVGARVPETAIHVYGSRLRDAGFHLQHAHLYEDRYLLSSIRWISVSEGFPSLRRSNVPSQVKRASYEIDLDEVLVPHLEFSDLVVELGGKWN